MVDVAGLRRLGLALPGVTAGDGPASVALSVGGKGLAWAYLARETPRARRLPVEGVVAIRCAIETKEMLIDAAPETFFDDDHYRGYPAVLARHARIDRAEMAGLLARAWRLSAPKALAKAHPAIGV
jgi:hypothetical protein